MRSFSELHTMWHGTRHSIYSRRRLLVACAMYSAISSGYVIATGLNVPELEWFFQAGLGLIAGTAVFLPLIWPSYRMTFCGVASFWIIGLLTLLTGVGEWRGLVKYFGRDGTLSVALEMLRWPIIGSFLLGMISTALFKLRLPRQFPAGHCIHCGYDLRHLPHSRCPECGTRNAEKRSPSGRG